MAYGKINGVAVYVRFAVFSSFNLETAAYMAGNRFFKLLIYVYFIAENQFKHKARSFAGFYNISDSMYSICSLVARFFVNAQALPAAVAKLSAEK